MYTVLGVLYIIYKLLEERFEEKGSLIFWFGLIIILAMLGVR